MLWNEYYDNHTESYMLQTNAENLAKWRQSSMDAQHPWVLGTAAKHPRSRRLWIILCALLAHASGGVILDRNM